ncbi:pyruvate kinase [Halobacteriales archaeon QS_1_68_20]|nr:MAG: pyruvate kinase [Halobacteriales archaeon QS_1_68_20]
MRNAKIVCTLGPASDAESVIQRMVEAGMAVARLNASHGTRDDRAAAIERVQAVDQRIDRPLATMVDLQGPEIRTAPLDEPVHLAEGSEVRFVEGETATESEVGLSHAIPSVDPGERILLDDALIEATILRVDDDAVVARIEEGGELGSRKGVNVPGVDLDLPNPTEDDRRELELAVEQDADYVAASFVRDAEDVYRVEEAIEDLGGEIPVVAKIERDVAVRNLDEIVDAAFGVMVARGDLGVECPMEDVPLIQKRIIRRCRESGTPVITATEMLDSMVHARRPTRAEASDVANAVLDGTDAVMLSAETAVGDDPVAVVETMDRIVRQVERSDEYAELREQRVPTASESRTEALARSARYLARDVGASAVVAASESGYTVLKTAKFRPGVPVVATTPNDDVRRRLALVGGVTARYAPYTDEGADAVVEKAVKAALDAGAADSGDTVVVLSGMMTELEGANTTNMLKVHVAAETLTTGRSVVPGWVSGPVSVVPDGDLTDVPNGAVVALPADFEGEFEGDLGRIAGIVDPSPGMTGYAAMIARELEVPMISDAPVTELSDGQQVTLDAERGVVYDGDISTATEADRR